MSPLRGEGELAQIAVVRNDDRFDSFTGLAKARELSAARVEWVRRDAHYRNAAEVRYAETNGKPWQFEPCGDARVDEFIKKQQARLDIDKMLGHALTAVETGFSVQELVLEIDKTDGLLYVSRAVGKPWHWFMFNQGWELLFIRDPLRPWEVERMPEPRMLVHTHSEMEGDRRGLAMAELAYWYVYARQGVIKYGLLFLEQIGGPTRFAWVPPGTTKNDKEEIAAALNLSSGQSSVVLTQGTDVKFMEVGTASASIHEAFGRWMDRYISKLMNGATMITEGTDGANGARATAEVHLKVLRNLSRKDVKDLIETMDRWVRWIVRQNFGPDSPVPRFFIQPEQDEIRAEIAKVYLEAVDRGVPIVESDFYRRTGIQKPGAGDVLLKRDKSVGANTSKGDA